MMVLPILFVALVLFTGGVALAVTERRRGIARTVVRQMAMVTSQNLPLGTGLMLAGKGERGKAGRILTRIADLASRGMPLGEATAQGYPNCPGLIVSVVQAAEQAGRLASALRMLSRDLDQQEQRRSKIMPMAIIYALFLLFVLLIVWTSIMIVIVPKFKEIFSDFSARLPSVTVFAMQFSEDVANRILIPVAVFWLVLAIPFGLYRLFRRRRKDGPGLLRRVLQSIGGVRTRGVAAVLLSLVLLIEILALLGLAGVMIFTPASFTGSLLDLLQECVALAAQFPWVLLGVLGFLMAIPLGLHWAFRSRRPGRPYTASVIADGVRWRVPGWGRMQMAEGMATFASLLRLFVGAGMPLGRAAALAGDADMNAVLRQRVRRFAELIDVGTPPPAAADQAGLGMILATALRSGQVGDRLDASLRFAADYYRSIVSRFWIVLRTIMWPVVTLIMAVLVATFVAAMFLPLVALINAVLETV